MKTWLKVLLGLVSLIVVILVIVFYFTAGMTESADNFFAAVKQKDMTAANSYLSEAFKTSTNEATLKKFLEQNALTSIKESSWSNRQVNEGGQGELEGVVTTDTGGTVPIKITFVKENDVWKIYNIEKSAAGLSTTTSEKTDTSKPALPDKTVQIDLVKQAMHDFLVSVKAKDMTHFRSTLSKLWQDQFSVEKLNEAYKSIVDNKADWSVIEQFTPELSAEAAIDNNGVLTLVGFYPTKPSRVTFEQGYIYEDNAWKLISFNIEAKPE